MKKYHIILRFSDHCNYPQAVAGRPCWTTDSSQVRLNKTKSPPDMEVFLTYRTADGRLRESFVSIRNLQLTTPMLSLPAFVIRPDTAQRVMKVAAFEKERTKPKKTTGVHLYNMSGSRSKTKFYNLERVTRVLPFDNGPP